MKGLVLSCEDGYTYVVLPGGQVRKLRGVPGEVGEEISIPPQVFTRRVMMLAAAVFVMACAYIGMLTLESHTMFVDMNPSVSVRFNLLGRATSAVALNDAGAALLDEVRLRGRAENVLETLLDFGLQNHWVSDDPIILVSVLTRTDAHESRLLARMFDLAHLRHGIQIHALPARRFGAAAAQHGLSPAMYYLAYSRGGGDSSGYLHMGPREMLEPLRE